MLHRDVVTLAEGMRGFLGDRTMTDLGLEQMRQLVDQVASGVGIPVRHVEDKTVSVEGREIPIRMYYPSVEKPRPVLMWFHGGGFALGSLATGDDISRRLCVAADVVVVSVDYRLIPEHPFPAGLEDCLAVFNWVKSGAAGHLVDGSRVAVAGDSAGGMLAMSLCVLIREQGGDLPDCQLSVYGAGDMAVSNPEFGNLPFLSVQDVEWFRDAYSSTVSKELMYLVNPGVVASLEGLPPLFMLTAEHDPTRDSCERHGKRMMKAVAGSRVRRYDGMYHGFFGRPEMFEESARAHADVVDFVQEHLCNV